MTDCTVASILWAGRIALGALVVVTLAMFVVAWVTTRRTGRW